MKLTPFARILIVVLVALGIFWAVRKFVPGVAGGLKTTTTTEQPTEKPTTTTTENKEVVPNTTTTSTKGAFTYTPAEPVDGKLKGVVELGASGFNAFVISIDNQKNWSLENAEYGASLVYENMATEQDIRSSLKTYIAKMLNFGVTGKDIHFVVSSSAIKSEEIQKIIKGLKSLGYFVNPVNAEEEGIYALQATLPKAFEDNSFVVDIGSGNTKISWIKNGEIISKETYGSKYFENGVSNETVFSEVQSLSKQVPADKRKTCFIIGGVPFELAKQTRNGKERYTVLNPADGYAGKGEKQKSGLNVYKAIAAGTKCETFVFDWDSNFTVGFLLGLKK
jgi:hypothetical protein